MFFQLYGVYRIGNAGRENSEEREGIQSDCLIGKGFPSGVLKVDLKVVVTQTLEVLSAI